MKKKERKSPSAAPMLLLLLHDSRLNLGNPATSSYRKSVLACSTTSIISGVNKRSRAACSSPSNQSPLQLIVCALLIFTGKWERRWSNGRLFKRQDFDSKHDGGRRLGAQTSFNTIRESTLVLYLLARRWTLDPLGPPPWSGIETHRSSGVSSKICSKTRSARCGEDPWERSTLNVVC